ncbi:MFS transporter [Dankookia sp. P2]|uniref:MFS transporter n=1 Tax=Dankookia sp. P2 TaxID=3423955 RepID=UPI003D676DB1
MPAAERPPVPAFSVAAVLLGCFIAGFHTRLFGIGLADLRGAMGLEPDQGAWLSTVALAPQILVAPAITWLVTCFGLRRVLVGPALAYALLSLLIPLVRDYPTLLVLHGLHGALLGAFVPAALMVIFRNMPQRLWIAGIALYVFRAGFTLNAGIGLTGFYAAQLGWQWIYWQDVLLAPLMAWLAWRGAPRVAVDRVLLAQADWGRHAAIRQRIDDALCRARSGQSAGLDGIRHHSRPAGRRCDVTGGLRRQRGACALSLGKPARHRLPQHRPDAGDGVLLQPTQHVERAAGAQLPHRGPAAAA